MNFAQFLTILNARKRILLLTLAVTVLATIIVSSLLPKSYQATSTIVMNFKGIDPLTGLVLPGQLTPGYMATQIDIIGSKNVALRVVDHLRLAESPAVQAQFQEATNGQGTVRDWLADLLLRKIEVEPSRESSVVGISFKGSDPAFVAAVANSFAEEYQRLSIQLKVEPMRKASGYFNDQIKVLRDNFEQAQSRLSKYQQEHGIVSVDNRLDVESTRLNDLSAQLVAAQTQAMEGRSRQSVAQGRGDSPDVNNNPLIQNLRASLSAAESKLAEVGQRLSSNHPQYLSARAEVEKLRASLNENLRLTQNTVGSNASVLNQRESEIRAALDAQRTRVLELNRTRDEMNVLSKDVESAQRAFEMASQRQSQTRIEGQSEQSDVALLNPAVAPLEASSPKVLLNVALSLFLGTLLGVGLCMLAEMFDRRVRSETDLTDIADVPVLGTINWAAPKRKRFSFGKKTMQHQLRLN
ncbi:chain length determinant protein EpsF [Pseudoduganella lurida]|uniref:Chain length determinant protein EpsF n=1 Tax=Pseudoduganella lurida TaxID=1036180 RepID=A0A562R7V2_9BURK|nr:chain length determinant protein EpsF [Pseudoduganella lurida]TWI65149.1 chain length determinant protein EpsF [Pseudoduganella lurida]